MLLFGSMVIRAGCWRLSGEEEEQGFYKLWRFTQWSCYHIPSDLWVGFHLQPHSQDCGVTLMRQYNFDSSCVKISILLDFFSKEHILHSRNMPKQIALASLAFGILLCCCPCLVEKKRTAPWFLRCDRCPECDMLWL